MDQIENQNLIPLTLNEMLEKVVDDEDIYVRMLNRPVESHMPYFVKLLDDFDCDLAASIIQKEELENFEIENWIAIQMRDESYIVIYTKNDGRISSNSSSPN